MYRGVAVGPDVLGVAGEGEQRRPQVPLTRCIWRQCCMLRRDPEYCLGDHDGVLMFEVICTDDYLRMKLAEARYDEFVRSIDFLATGDE